MWHGISKYALWFEAEESENIFKGSYPPDVSHPQFGSKEHPQNLTTVALPQTPQLILLPPSSQPVGPKLCHLLCVFVVVPVIVVWCITSWLVFVSVLVRQVKLCHYSFFIIEFLTCMDAFSHRNVCVCGHVWPCCSWPGRLNGLCCPRSVIPVFSHLVIA